MASKPRIETLTPIRVRGRKKQRITAPRSSLKQDESSNIPTEAQDECTRSSKSTSSQSKYKGGRPLLSSQSRSGLSQSKRSKRTGLFSIKPESLKKQQNQLSLLESLPLELLEKIFFESLNVNFARTSPVLAAAVSTERVYRALILLAFWDNDDELFFLGPWSPTQRGVNLENFEISNAVSRILRPLEYDRALSQGERKAFQSDVLRCRWCTLWRIVDQLPDLLRLTVQRRWLDTGFTMEDDQKDALHQFLAQGILRQQPDDPLVFEGTCNDKIYTISIHSPLSVSIGYLGDNQRQHQTHRVLSVMEIPDKILTADPETGFSDEGLTSLELFRLASGFNRLPLLDSHSISLSRDAVQQGIHTALVTRNSRALTSLLKIDEYYFRTAENNNNNRMVGVDYIREEEVFYTISAEHFRAAALSTPHDSSMFQLLLRASAESIPADDSQITQWAMDLLDRGDEHDGHDAAASDGGGGNAGEFGRWLLDLMLSLPQQVEDARQNPRMSMFYMGGARGNVDMSRRYLQDVLRVEELGTWMHETFLDLSRYWPSEDKRR